MTSGLKPIYGLDDRPELPRALVLGAQHVLTMFGATVSVPLLLGPVMGMSAAEIARLISSVMLCSGLATIVQVKFGSKLPIVQGVSFSFLAAFFLIIGTTSAEAEATGVGAGPLPCSTSPARSSSARCSRWWSASAAWSAPCASSCRRSSSAR